MSETKAGAIKQTRADRDFEKWWRAEGVKPNKFLTSSEAKAKCKVAWQNGAYFKDCTWAQK